MTVVIVNCAHDIYATYGSVDDGNEVRIIIDKHIRMKGSVMNVTAIAITVLVTVSAMAASVTMALMTIASELKFRSDNELFNIVWGHCLYGPWCPPLPPPTQGPLWIHLPSMKGESVKPEAEVFDWLRMTTSADSCIAGVNHTDALAVVTDTVSDQ